jgi:FkbM family methyltransferase
VPDMLSFIGQCKELFVDEIYNFQSKSSSPVIFDCGANVGTSCVYFKTLYPTAKIKAFEADDNITQYLRENLQHNNITDVDVIDSAVWIHSDGISFSCEGADGGSIQGSDNLNKVKSIRLRDYLQKEEIVDLLKIDIEGAEYEVLKDCKDTLDNVENIFIEYHSWNNSPQKLSEILAILEKNNFRYYISSISERSHPFINIGLDQNMDLQLNIFGVRRY